MTTTETVTIVAGLVLLYAGIKGFKLYSYLKAVAANPSANPGQYYVNSLVPVGGQAEIKPGIVPGASTGTGSVQAV
jgi:hypothetical protein